MDPIPSAPAVPLVSVVVPVYREARSLQRLVDELTRVTRSVSGAEFEIIFVNDGSPDDSLLVLKGIAEKRPDCKIVDLSRLICASPDWTPNSVNNTRTRLGGWKQLPRLDRFARKADPLLPAEQREQHLDPLMRLHAGVEPKLSSERPDRDLHAGAHARSARLGELNQPVALA